MSIVAEQRRGPGRPALPWFRMYSGFSTCAKASALTDAEFRTWIIVLDEASKNTPRGRLPSIRAAAYRSSRPQTHIRRLIKIGLVDEEADGQLVLHDWDHWQYRHSPYDPVAGGRTAISRENSSRAGGGISPENSVGAEAFISGGNSAVPDGGISQDNSVCPEAGISPENYPGAEAGISPENKCDPLAYLTSTTALLHPETEPERGRGNIRAVEVDVGKWPRWKRAALAELRRARDFDFTDADAGEIIDRAERKLAGHGLSVVSLCERLADWVNNPPPGVKRPRTLLPLVTRWTDTEIDHQLGVQREDYDVPGLDRRRAEGVA